MSALGVKGLMTSKEWQKKRRLTDGYFGVPTAIKEILYFFESSVGETDKDEVAAKENTSFFLNELSTLEKKIKKTIVIAEYSTGCHPCNLGFYALFGDNFIGNKVATASIKANDAFIERPFYINSEDKKVLIDFLDPAFSYSYPDSAEYSLSSFSSKYSINSNQDYQNYLKNNFIFIVFYSYGLSNANQESFMNSQLDFFATDRIETSFLGVGLSQYYYYKDSQLKHLFNKKDPNDSSEKLYFVYGKDGKQRDAFGSFISKIKANPDFMKQPAIPSTTDIFDPGSYLNKLNDLEKSNVTKEEAEERIRKLSIDLGIPTPKMSPDQRERLYIFESDHIIPRKRFADIIDRSLRANDYGTKGKESAVNSLIKGTPGFFEKRYIPNSFSGIFNIMIEEIVTKGEVTGYKISNFYIQAFENSRASDGINQLITSNYQAFLKQNYNLIAKGFYDTFLKKFLEISPPGKKEIIEPVAIVPQLATPEPPAPTPQPEPVIQPEPIVAAPPPPPPPPIPEIKPTVEEPKPVNTWPLKYLTEEDILSFKEMNSILVGNETESPYQPWLHKDYVSNIFTKTKVLPLTIEDGPDFKTKDNVLVSISGGINSLTANIPILGQAYPTTQFLSSMEPNYQLNLIASNNMHANGLEDSASDLPNAIKRLEEINTTTLRTAREYKFVPDGSSILVDSFITRLFGSFKEEYVILDNTDNLGSYYVTLKKPISIESTEYRTLESNPGASAYSMRLSETNVYDPEVLKEVTTNKKLKNDQLYNDVVNYALMNCDNSQFANRNFNLKENVPKTMINGDYFEWESKYFKSWDFFKDYRNKKDELKNLLKDLDLTITVNMNLYTLASKILDPLVDLLKTPPHNKLFKGVQIVSGFSTADQDERTTFSQHYYGAAADIVIPNFNALYIAEKIIYLCNKSQISLGLGVYGHDILKPQKYVTDFFEATHATVMGDQKSDTGFIHVDLRLRMLNSETYDSKLLQYATEKNTTVEALKDFDKRKYDTLSAEEKVTYEDLRRIKLLSLKNDTLKAPPVSQSDYYWSASKNGQYAINLNGTQIGLGGPIDLFKDKVIVGSEPNLSYTVWEAYNKPELISSDNRYDYLYNVLNKDYTNNNLITNESQKSQAILSLNNPSSTGNISTISENEFDIDEIDTDMHTDFIKDTRINFSKETSVYDESLRQEKFFDQLNELFNRDVIDNFFGTNYEERKFSEIEDSAKQNLMSSNVTNESPVYIYNIEKLDDLAFSEKYNEFSEKYKIANQKLNVKTPDVLRAYFKENKIDAYIETMNDRLFSDYKIYILDPLTTSTFTKRQTSNAVEEIKVKRLLSMICDFHLLAGILLIEPYVYTDNVADAQKKLSEINSNFYGINVTPMYFNNLFFAITGSSLENPSTKALSKVKNVNQMSTKSFFFKFQKSLASTYSTSMISNATVAGAALLLVFVGIAVVAASMTAIIAMQFLAVDAYLESEEKQKTFKRGRLASSSFSNLLILKRLILDQSELNFYKQNEKTALDDLEYIYTQLEYKKDVNFSLTTLFTKMNTADEIIDFTKDIINQFILNNPIVLKFSETSNFLKEQNAGITFSLDNIINRNFFEDKEIKQTSNLVDNNFINLEYASDWLKYILGFPYRENDYFDDVNFADNHEVVFYKEKDKVKYILSYFKNASKERSEINDDFGYFITKDEARNLGKSINAEREKYLKEKEKIKAFNKKPITPLEISEGMQPAIGLTQSYNKVELSDFFAEMRLKFISKSNLEEVVKFKEKEEINDSPYEVYLKGIFNNDESAIEEFYTSYAVISNLKLRIKHPSGDVLASNTLNSEFSSLYISLTNNNKDNFEVKKKFTLTDNVIAIMRSEKLRDLSKESLNYNYINYDNPNPNDNMEDRFKREFESFKINEDYNPLDAKRPEYKKFLYERNLLPGPYQTYNTKEFISKSEYGKSYTELNEVEKKKIDAYRESPYVFSKNPEKFIYQNLKDLFFNIIPGTKEADFKKFEEHNKVAIAFLKNMLEEIIKELLLSELFKANLNISGDENVSDSFDFGKDKNNYPDIDLPIDPSEVNSNVNLNPGFFYYESDFNDKILRDVDNRANNILRKSLKFMNDLESGFISEDGKNLQKGNQADNYIKDIIIDTQDSSASSFLIKGGEGDSFKDLVLNPNASVKINFQQDSMTALTANDIAFIDIRNLVESSKSEDRFTNLTKKIEEIEEKTKSIDIAFGSRTGFLNEPLNLLNFYKTYNQKGDSLFFGNSNTENAIAGKLGIFDDADLSNSKEDISMVMKQSGRKLFEKQFKMQKAYPTFRLFLIEEDAIESDTYFVFDDFYSFSAVKDFTVYKSKKLAADTAIIRLQNVSGVLDGTKLGVIRDVDYEMATNTIKEVEAEKKAEEKNTQVIESLVLRPGVTCQLRAGYSSNPKELTILLSGKIADVSWSSNGDMCEVVVQSFGVELEVRKYGSSDADSGVSELEFHTTHKLLGWCMFRNELKHFGRFKKERLFQTGINNSESKEVVISKESYIGTPPGYSDSMFQFFQSNWAWFVVADVLLSIGTVFIGGAKGLVKEAVSEAAEAVAKTAAKETAETAAKEAGKEVAEAAVTEAAKAAAKSTAKGSFISKTAQYLASAMNISDDLLTGSKWYSKGLLAPFRWAFGSGWNPGANTVIVNNVLKDIAKAAGNLTDEALESSIRATLVKVAPGGRGYFLTTIGKAFGLNMAFAGSNLQRLLTVSPKAILSGIQKATKEGILDQKVANALVKEMSTKFNLIYAGRSALESFSLGFVKASKFSILALGIGASIDIISNVVSASTGYLSDLISNTLNPYSEKIALSPQDDAIYAPHPDRYIKPKNETIGVRFTDIMKKTGVAFLNAMSMYQAEANAEKLQKDIILGRTLAMDKRMYSSSGENIFKLKNHTIWEVFHEMSLRHPGWVYGARHYGTGLEYRMFFGLPNQRYFGAPLNNRTIYRMNDIIRAISNNDLASMRKLVGETANTIDNYLKDADGLNKTNFDKAKSAIYKGILLNEWNRVTEKRFTPFRNYHLVSSKFNLVANNIKGVNNDVINEIAVLFVNNSSTENPEYTQRIIRSHENIPEDQIHAKAVKYDNCKGFNSALRYGTSELLNAAKEMYAGEILILGNPEINPYDVILLDDQYSEMYGPIEVEAVTHIFGMDTGFITEIKPNVLVTANEGLTYPIINSVIMYDVGRELAEKSPFDFVNTVKTYRKDPNNQSSKNTIKTRLNELVNKWFDKEVGTFELFGLFPNTVQIGFSDYLRMDFNQQAKIKESIVEDLLKQIQTNNIVLQAEILNPNASIDSLVDTSAITGLLSSAAAIALATTVKFGTTKLPIAFFTALAAGSGNFNSIINNQLRTPDSLLANKLIPGDMLVSQVADGNLMQIFPLYKNNKPLIYAGYDKINAKRRIKNKFGNIFTDFSDAMETFNIMLKEYANKENIIYSEPNFISEVAGTLSDAAQSLLPFKLPAGTIRGYINSYTPDQLINKSLK